MDDPRRMQGGQRPPMGSMSSMGSMGPPETPSRVMQASPNMFPSLQFSPDLFSMQNMSPMTAPVFPQQRLFWDPSTAAPEQHNTQFVTPFQDTYDNSFNSSSTIVPGFVPMVPQEQSYDLPQLPHSAGPFLDPNTFPTPFQTSPRPLPPPNENPTLFLSSPARRFGGAEVPNKQYPRMPPREVPAYHHQIQESRREMEAERERRRSRIAKRADDELIMQSVRRALSPSKVVRPGLKRSQTHSGLPLETLQLRRQSGVLFNDSASASSVTSNTSSRNGRSSPLKQRPFAGITKSRMQQRQRTMSLAIDENGVAKTVLRELPESDNDDTDMDNDSVASSTDENDFHMLQSQQNSFAVIDDEYPQPTNKRSSNTNQYRRPLDSSVTGSAQRLNRLSLSGIQMTNSRSQKYPDETIRRSSRASVTMDPNSKGDAQKALRAIIQDRSRSTSTQEDYSSSRQSDSSVQFHSSPPVQPGPFGALSGSPTTITDPDLATPSTDHDSYASLGAMRCVCNSTSPNSSSMVQCDLCSNWLHSKCVGIDSRRIPEGYTCVYCEQTPIRHPTNRGSLRSSMRGAGTAASPLAHKSSGRKQRTK